MLNRTFLIILALHLGLAAAVMMLPHTSWPLLLVAISFFCLSVATAVRRARLLKG